LESIDDYWTPSIVESEEDTPRIDDRRFDGRETRRQCFLLDGIRIANSIPSEGGDGPLGVVLTHFDRDEIQAPLGHSLTNLIAHGFQATAALGTNFDVERDVEQTGRPRND
jgi:hypothetical protein